MKKTLLKNRLMSILGLIVILIASVSILNFCKKDLKTSTDKTKSNQMVRSDVIGDTCYGLSAKGDSLRLIWSRDVDSVTVITKVIHRGEEPRSAIHSTTYIYDLPFDTVKRSVTRSANDHNKYFFIPLDPKLICSPWYNLGGALASWEGSCFCDEGEHGADCMFHTSTVGCQFYCTTMQGCGCCGTDVRLAAKGKSEDTLHGNYIFIRANVINYNGKIIK